MSFELKGIITEIAPAQQVSAKFRKRDLVLEYADNPQYPEFIKFEFVQDKCELLDEYAVGQEVEVFFNVKGRRWTDPKGEVKYFTSLQGWRINASGSADTQPVASREPEVIRPGTDWAPNGDGSDNDLPF